MEFMITVGWTLWILCCFFHQFNDQTSYEVPLSRKRRCQLLNADGFYLERKLWNFEALISGTKYLLLGVYWLYNAPEMISLTKLVVAKP